MTCFCRFVENLNDLTSMKRDEGDLLVSQLFGDGRRRTLRLTSGNLSRLRDNWEDLLNACKEAKKDKLVDFEVALGDRVKVSVSTDFPNLHFRRWRLPAWNGQVLPGGHGFVLFDQDFPIFEKNVKLFLQ